MKTSPEQIQIVRNAVNGFLPVAENPACVEKIVEIVLKYVEGNTNRTTARCDVRDALTGIGKKSTDERLNLCITTAYSLAKGYSRWMQGQENADELDIYPALQLSDCYYHVEPVDWVTKWKECGGRVFERNEMIALKNDPIWSLISIFNLPFPPFDLGSGMDVDGIPRNEAEKLGLISPNEKIEPIIIDLDFTEALQQRVKEYFIE